MYITLHYIHYIQYSLSQVELDSRERHGVGLQGKGSPSLLLLPWYGVLLYCMWYYHGT